MIEVKLSAAITQKQAHAVILASMSAKERRQSHLEPPKGHERCLSCCRSKASAGLRSAFLPPVS
jgi:hypothetical protein